MSLSNISLNLLRAFDASARHLSFTGASKELFVTQAAVAHQVKALEDYLQKPLFNRLARGLTLTDAGANLAPIVAKSLNEMSNILEAIKGDAKKAVLHIGVVGTFALGFLLPRLNKFYDEYKDIKLQLSINNNVPDLLNEHLDFAVRFGDGAWLALRSEFLMSAPLTPLCSPLIAEKLNSPSDLGNFELLRSHRKNEWARLFNHIGIRNIQAKGPIFDNSRAIADAAAMGIGIALLPKNMFQAELKAQKLCAPFDINIDAGAYYLTRLVQNNLTEPMECFQNWLMNECLQYNQNELN